MFLRFKNISMNTENVGYIENKDNELYLNYKKKASIQKVKMELTEEIKKDLNRFFAKYGFFNLEGYFINPNNITFIQETTENDNGTNYTNLIMYFKDSMNLEFKVPTNRWKVWKDNRMKSGY